MSEQCHICLSRYEYVYRVPDEVWEQISPRPNGAGLLCLDCVHERATQRGITLYFDGNPGWWAADSTTPPHHPQEPQE